MESIDDDWESFLQDGYGDDIDDDVVDEVLARAGQHEPGHAVDSDENEPHQNQRHP